MGQPVAFVAESAPGQGRAGSELHEQIPGLSGELDGYRVFYFGDIDILRQIRAGQWVLLVNGFEMSYL
jgi:hypothetical protein